MISVNVFTDTNVTVRVSITTSSGACPVEFGNPIAATDVEVEDDELYRLVACTRDSRADETGVPDALVVKYLREVRRQQRTSGRDPRR